MKKKTNRKGIFIFLILYFLSSSSLFSQMLSSDSCSLRFFSTAPLEDIEAKNSDAKSMINPAKNEIGVAVVIRGFRFVKAMMQEHFNENYMESEKYPKATFKGIINEPVDWTKTGVYDASVTGTLDIHGVQQQRTITGKLIIRNDAVLIDSKFKVKLADHNIKIPSLVAKNIAEEADVFFYARYPLPHGNPTYEKK